VPTKARTTRSVKTPANDSWTDIISKLATFLPRDGTSDISPEDAARAAELADFEKMESIRARVDTVVKDKATTEALKPVDAHDAQAGGRSRWRHRRRLDAAARTSVAPQDGCPVGGTEVVEAHAAAVG
jgi:hypothetical protein